MKSLFLALMLLVGPGLKTIYLNDDGGEITAEISYFTKISTYVGTIVVTDLKMSEFPDSVVSIVNFPPEADLTISFSESWTEMVLSCSCGREKALEPPFYIGYGPEIGYKIFVEP